MPDRSDRPDRPEVADPPPATSASELDVARSLAHEAGALIREALGRARTVDRKSPVNLVTEVDRAAERIIVDGLSRAFPSHAIVAEESADGSRPAAASSEDGSCWYVDPLDGTTNFVHGLPHCCVSIALQRNGRMQTAVVFDPFRDETFEAERGNGARLGDEPLRVSPNPILGDALLVTGFPYDRREHLDFYMSYMAAFMLESRDIRRFGSAALDLCYVAAGRFDGFWEWKLQPWDTAAGFLIVEEAGGRVTDFDDGDYDPWDERILATNAAIHEAAVRVLAGLPRQP
jgi:myo-inositol-1(or 4)-monophosphatase